MAKAKDPAKKANAFTKKDKNSDGKLSLQEFTAKGKKGKGAKAQGKGGKGGKGKGKGKGSKGNSTGTQSS